MKARINGEKYFKKPKFIIGLDNNRIDGWQYATEEQETEQGFLTVIERPLQDDEQYGEIEWIEGQPYYSIVKKIIPTPEELFDSGLCKTDLMSAFAFKLLDFAPYYSILDPMINGKEFKWINMYSQGLLHAEKLDEAEYEAFKQVFLKQNIVITDYID